MAFSVGDFHDLVRLLEERPEWRAELRRLVLSDELLELPEIVRQLAERMDQLAERMDRLAERVDRLAEAQVRSEHRLAGIEAAIDRLVEAQQRTETRLGRLDGSMLELQYERHGMVYFSRIARRLRVVPRTRLAELLDDAVDDGRLTLDERDAVMWADVVLRGRRPDGDGDLYVLAEVSVAIDPHGVERAAERAAILAKLGDPVVPAVGAQRIDADALALARERGVWQALDRQLLSPTAS